MTGRADVAVVGGGILGLAFAWAAARRGNSVVVLERGRRAEGASVRNFGMVWPIGQPAGELYRIAMRGRELWLELGRHGGVHVNPCGSVHAVYEDDEDALVREFAGLAPGLGVACEYVPAAAARVRFPAVRHDDLQGVLHSPTELCVDPRQAVARLPEFLAAAFGVRFHFDTAVTAVEPGAVRTAAGSVIPAGRVFVCFGADFETLFPTLFAGSGVRKCKLQMMRTAPQPGGWKLGPHLAGGLTLGHYKSFEVCRTLAAVKKRHAEQYPDHARYGIHVMAAQNPLGEVVIGDSHEYDGDITPFDSARIDELILDYLANMLELPDPRPAARWHGVYAKHPTKPLFVADPVPGCTVVNAPGGAGMTTAFGFADAWWDAHAAGREFVVPG